MTKKATKQTAKPATQKTTKAAPKTKKAAKKAAPKKKAKPAPKKEEQTFHNAVWPSQILKEERTAKKAKPAPSKPKTGPSSLATEAEWNEAAQAVDATLDAPKPTKEQSKAEKTTKKAKKPDVVSQAILAKNALPFEEQQKLKQAEQDHYRANIKRSNASLTNEDVRRNALEIAILRSEERAAKEARKAKEKEQNRAEKEAERATKATQKQAEKEAKAEREAARAAKEQAKLEKQQARARRAAEMLKIKEDQRRAIAQAAAQTQTKALELKTGLELDHMLFHSWSDAIQAFDALQDNLAGQTFEEKFSASWPFTARHSKAPNGEYCWIIAFPKDESSRAKQALSQADFDALDRLQQLEIMSKYLPAETIERDRQTYLANLERAEKLQNA